MHGFGPRRFAHSKIEADGNEPSLFKTRMMGLAPNRPRCSQALFRWLLLDPVAALSNGNDPEWRRYPRGTEERYIRLVIREILIDATERVLG
jgi:hypothetical protein